MKRLFIVFALLLVGLSVWVALSVDYSKPWVFYAVEGFVLTAIVLLWMLYRKTIKPLQIISYGMDMLKGQDFGSRLSPVGQKEADRVVGIFNRMMDRLKNERLRLREQNYFLDLLIHASPMGVVIVSPDGNINQINPMALSLFNVGGNEVVLNRQLSAIPSPLARELARLLEGESKTIGLNDSGICKCTRSFFIDTGFKHPFYLIESLTEEVRMAEKKAYEKVIRMMAHEVGNTVAGVTSTLDTVDQALSETPGTEDICKAMQVCTERCYSMSRFIARFADVVKIPEPHAASLDLNEIALSCKRFMEGMCAKHHIVITLKCESQPVIVWADAVLIEQAVVNIIKNAAESIGETGEIIICTTLVPPSFEVIDTGKGIAPEMEAKLFTPFFSTKPNGQGVGLMFIREVLHKQGCTFSLRTRPEDGRTGFRIVF